MYVRHPIWLKRASIPGAEAFALLFTFESFARSILVSILPLDVLRLMGNASDVSLVFFAVGSMGIFASFFIPLLIGMSARRVVYTGGLIMLISAPAMMAVGVIETQLIGMFLRTVGVITITICLNLYALDYIAKREFNRAEPMRLLYSAGAWVFGPVIGTYLYTQVSPAAAYAVASICAVGCLAYFWYLRLSDDKAIVAGKIKAKNPFKFFKRYLSQPRLVVAWLIAIGRSVYWNVLFIYTPIFAIQSGLGAMAGGYILGLCSFTLFLTPVWAKFLRVLGVRTVLMIGFALAGVALLATSYTMEWPYLVVLSLVFGALLMSFADSVGNMSFLMAVKPNERASMTSVYSTYRDVGELAPPGVFALLLRYYELAAVFFATSIVMFGVVGLASRVHPRLGRAREHDPKFNASAVAKSALRLDDIKKAAI